MCNKNEVCHTPGPWELESPPSGVHMVVSQQERNLIIASTYNIPKDDPGDALANARLIAVAPGMLSELEGYAADLTSYQECGTTPTVEWVNENLLSLKAIIAQARGKK